MNGHQVIRIDPSGPELFCRYCKEFFPITSEYWGLQPQSLQVRADRCRLCNKERSRLYQALRRRDPSFNERERIRHRNYYRRWIATNEPVLLPVYDRERLEVARDRGRYRRAS